MRMDSNVEMSWKVFCGDHQTTLTALFLLRCHRDNIATEQEQATEFRKHLGRGIKLLNGMQKRLNIASLIESAISDQKPS